MLHWWLRLQATGTERFGLFFLRESFFFHVVLLDACILGISGLIDLVMGRSEQHAGMKKRAHILTDTHTSSSHSDIHIYVNTLHKSSHPCFIKNTNWPPSAPFYFIVHRVKLASLYTPKHTCRYIHTQ